MLSVYSLRKVTDLLARNGNGSKNFDVKLKTDVQSKLELMDDISELFKGDDEVALESIIGNYLKRRGYNGKKKNVYQF